MADETRNPDRSIAGKLYGLARNAFQPIRARDFTEVACAIE